MKVLWNHDDKSQPVFKEVNLVKYLFFSLSFEYQDVDIVNIIITGLGFSVYG